MPIICYQDHPGMNQTLFSGHVCSNERIVTLSQVEMV